MSLFAPVLLAAFWIFSASCGRISAVFSSPWSSGSAASVGAPLFGCCIVGSACFVEESVSWCIVGVFADQCSLVAVACLSTGAFFVARVKSIFSNLLRPLVQRATPPAAANFASSLPCQLL